MEYCGIVRDGNGSRRHSYFPGSRDRRDRKNPRDLCAASHVQRISYVRGRLMKREYDFSRGERGRFYQPDAQFNIPIYLDEEVLAYLGARARARGIEISQLS